MRRARQLRDEATAAVAVGAAAVRLNPARELSRFELAAIGVRTACVLIRWRGLPARLGVIAALAVLALTGCTGV